MGTAHGSDELGLCRYIGFCLRYIRIWPYLEKILGIEYGKIFCVTHNFVPQLDFDKIIFEIKLWDSGDADCGIARVNRATRARTIGTYLQYKNLTDHQNALVLARVDLQLCTQQ